MKVLQRYLGELIGTFIIVLFGCGTVAGAVLFNAFTSLYEVAIVWGITVAVAIYITRNYCSSHLNPAVSIAMFLDKHINWKQLVTNVLAQLTGALLGGIVLYTIFNGSIMHYEATNGITRGAAESIKTAMIFGEFYPNPSFQEIVTITTFGASLLEGFGTFILVLVIFQCTYKKEQIDNLTPLIIGGTVSLLICFIAPFTQGGFNPARDLMPRIVAYFSGWETAALPSTPSALLTVYVLGPIGGAILATVVHQLLIKKV